MKKTYINPSVESIEVSNATIIAASEQLPIVPGGGEQPGEGAQGREDNTPSRPNLWEQGW